MKNIATSEVLNQAADAIQMAGWTQGQGWAGQPDTDGLCLEGGIMAAVGMEYDREALGPPEALRICPAYAAVQSYLGQHPAMRLFFWNDDDASSQEQVIEVLRAAAAVERVKEDTQARILGGDAPAEYDREDQPLPLEVAA